ELGRVVLDQLPGRVEELPAVVAWYPAEERVDAERAGQEVVQCTQLRVDPAVIFPVHSGDGDHPATLRSSAASPPVRAARETRATGGRMGGVRAAAGRASRPASARAGPGAHRGSRPGRPAG